MQLKTGKYEQNYKYFTFTHTHTEASIMWPRVIYLCSKVSKDLPWRRSHCTLHLRKERKEKGTPKGPFNTKVPGSVPHHCLSYHKPSTLFFFKSTYQGWLKSPSFTPLVYVYTIPQSFCQVLEPTQGLMLGLAFDPRPQLCCYDEMEYCAHLGCSSHGLWNQQLTEPQGVSVSPTTRSC